jgi:dGTPase
MALSHTEKRDICRFEGNAQGFRVLTQTENHLFRGGLRLTCATLGAFLKYPWTSRVLDKDKFGAYLAEVEVLRAVA